MAFKIKAPFHVEGAGSTIDPGKKINLTKKDSPDFAKSGVGSKIISYQQYRDSGGVPKGMEKVFSGKGTLRVSKSFTGKKSSGQGEGTGRGSGSSIKGTSADTRTYNPFSTKPVTKTKPVVEVKSKRKSSAKNTEIKASGQESKLSQTSLGKKGKQKKFGDEVTMQSTRNNKKSAPKENTLDAINKVSMKSNKFEPVSKESKAAPKDNSRKAIKARKTADKKAGVSKSQMRANKAKSKSEAALEKAKKSKNPDYRAQLKRKSDRLAKRAKRKGGSPVKATGDPKPRTHAEILKAYPGAVKVPGKINTYKYKGTTLRPALSKVENKGKTVKQAIEAKNK